MPGKRETLKQLIDAGLLQVGEELSCKPNKRSGQTFHASLNSDGLIVYQGQTFGSSPSNWAKHVSGGERNGWDYVYARGKPLDHFREQFRTQEPQTLGTRREPVQDTLHSNDRAADVESLQSRLVNLQSQVESQQSAIANLNMKIDSLPASPPEEDTEDDLIGYLRERVLKLEPSEFEILVGEYLKAKGFSNVVVSGRSGDGGIDGYCEIPFIRVSIAYQAKRYAVGNNIDAPTVREFQGSMTSKFDRGLFITTSDFTMPARGWIEESQAQITLINGEELMKEMLDLGLGVKDVTVIKHEVDEGFFADLEKK